MAQSVEAHGIGRGAQTAGRGEGGLLLLLVRQERLLKLLTVRRHLMMMMMVRQFGLPFPVSASFSAVAMDDSEPWLLPIVPVPAWRLSGLVQRLCGRRVRRTGILERNDADFLSEDIFHFVGVGCYCCCCTVPSIPISPWFVRKVRFFTQNSPAR
uniref:Uncharacterized protein n=1 Tax=Anopheles coluzzii TaxID=1518534 RepID=A0A8W7PKG5_ANOCL